ncbi:response regulator [Actinomadura sp. GC306]|uniref:response regulator transcription factor n=1 Tax=Actinomadura sp. GC306 TaxID=2530367 RepID=UPI0010536E64|nr:response regulator [Actinomadura sp. GC306]TDC69825.1 response regulator [Actinomadura sp. GC306]
MKPIRALVVDDDQKYIDGIRKRFDVRFHEFGWQVTWTTTTDPDEAIDLIRHQEPFELVIVDLLFVRTDMEDEDEPRGLELIRAARARSRDTFIFAISTGDPRRKDLFDNAKRDGAHRVVRRSEFSEDSVVKNPAAIAEEIRSHLLNRGTVVEMTLRMADERDPALQGLVHEVGAPTLTQLYAAVLRREGLEAREMTVGFLTPGVSGAAVCSVSAQVDGAGPPHHVLKISRDERSLREEVERGRLAERVLSSWLVRRLLDEPVGPVNGWYAVCSALANKATTMRAWLAGGPPPAVVEDVLEILFIEALHELYRANLQETEDVLSLLQLSHHRQHQVRQALQDYSEVMGRPDGCGLGDAVPGLVQKLSEFVLDGRLPGVSPRSLPRHTFHTYAHGDLHGGNVLVYQGRHATPTLIDPSLFGEAHWAVDPARFAVDLIMRSVDAGAESMFFAGFATWRSVVTRFSTGDRVDAAVTSTPGTVAAVSALNWLATNLPRVCPVLTKDEDNTRWRWEWHVALARQLLWATCHENLPPPKRALAMVAAHDQLQMAVQTLPERSS